MPMLQSALTFAKNKFPLLVECIFNIIILCILEGLFVDTVAIDGNYLF
jgi:transposase